jgi:hypothetical protein
MKLLLECSALILPALIYAIRDDRRGDVHPNKDWVFTFMIMELACIGVSTFEYFSAYPGSWTHLRWINIKCLCVSVSSFGLFFPLLFNWAWYRNSAKNMSRLKYSFTHLSPSAWPDKLFIKFKFSWWVRLCIYLTLFITSVIWFAW